MVVKLRDLLFGIVAFFFVSIIFSQQTLLKKANKEYEKYEYINAQRTYLEIIEKGYKSADVYKKLGNTYYFNSQFKEASTWYKELIENYKEELDPEYYYKYAQTLKSLGNYKDANLYMNDFVKLRPLDKRAELFKKNLDYLEKTKNDTSMYSITNLAMNAAYTDFGTTFYGENILFSSSRGDNDIHEWNKESYLDFYIAKYEPNSNQLYDIEIWENNFNSSYHESTAVFTKDKQTVYFTRNNEHKSNYEKFDLTGKMRTDRLKIYQSTLDEDGKWSKPKPLPFNSDNYSVAHPALSIDEKKLYFSSDMTGGIGESDIYVVTINDDNTFDEPKNLGQKINTEGKETFPFISSDNNLYFSSNGHVGLGGLDVFVIKNLENQKDFKIKNMGKNINSSHDDFAFIINDKTKQGFFSSNRNTGKGKDDIYSFIDTTFSKKKEKNPVDPKPKPIIIVEKNPEPIIVIKKGDDLAKVLALKPIYFDLDKSFIRPDAAEELDKVFNTMEENPTMKIKVRSHTDSRAIWYYNTALSKRRAKSTRLYLIKKGINPNRIKAWGYGESELLNHCSDGIPCSEEEHQLNRRSEFIVIEY